MSMKITARFLIFTAFIILLYIVIGRRDLKKFMREEVEFAINFNYMPLVEKGEHNLLEAPEGKTNGEGTCNYSNNHFIIYGSTGSGKTYWLKKNYLEKFNLDYHVYSYDKNEWNEDKQIKDLNEIKKLSNTIIIFDDVENELKKYPFINDLFLNGRHKNIQCIIIAHTTKIVSNQIRQNINNILITTNNSLEFYKQIKETYGIRFNIEDIKEPYGMILYEMRKNKITISDKDGNVST